MCVTDIIRSINGFSVFYINDFVLVSTQKTVGCFSDIQKDLLLLTNKQTNKK